MWRTAQMPVWQQVCGWMCVDRHIDRRTDRSEDGSAGRSCLLVESACLRGGLVLNCLRY